MLIFVLENQLECLLSYLSQSQKEAFGRSFAEKQHEDWVTYLQALNRVKCEFDSHEHLWTCPHCFRKDCLNDSFRIQGEQCFKKGEIAFFLIFL